MLRLNDARLFVKSWRPKRQIRPTYVKSTARIVHASVRFMTVCGVHFPFRSLCAHALGFGSDANAQAVR